MKLTKNELRDQQRRLTQLEKYLPTLQLKKAMLQSEVLTARNELQEKEEAFEAAQAAVAHFFALLEERFSLDMKSVAKIDKVEKSYENIAGVEIPILEEIHFAAIDYSLFDTPVWVEGAIEGLRRQERERIALDVAGEKVAALEDELRQVSIRVNLFEKVLIPRHQTNIKKIKVFLQDQELAAVGRAKVAKAKIVARKEVALAH